MGSRVKTTVMIFLAGNFEFDLDRGGQFVVRGQELPMYVPILKIVALPVCEILRGFQNFDIGSRTPGHAHLGANLWSMGKNCPRPMCVPNLKIVALAVCEILRGSQNFKIGSCTAGDTQFQANLWSGGKNCAQAMCMPNLKIVAFSVCKILRGSQNFKIRSRTAGDAHLGANLWYMGKNCPWPMCVPNLKGVALSVCEILAHFAAVHWPRDLDFWPWRRCGSHMWPAVTLCKVSSSWAFWFSS